MRTLLQTPLLRAVLLAVYMACILAMSLGRPPTAFGYIDGSCGERIVVRDYLEPLNRLVPIPEPPASGKMPFAPRGMNLRVAGERLVVGGGELGFALSDDAVDQLRHLNWVIETELVRLNRKGEAVARLGVKRRSVGTIRGNHIRPFLHQVPNNPGYYRVDIRFLRRGTGRLLGRYSTYARAVRARTELRMELETPSVWPGEYARAYLLNMGTTPIEFPSQRSAWHVQAFTDGKWRSVPPNPRILEPKVRRRLHRSYTLWPGTKTQICYLVKDDQDPGLFRFSTRGLSAEFEVRAPQELSPSYRKEDRNWSPPR